MNDIESVRKRLSQRFSMHIRMSKGQSMLCYNILDGDREIGSKTIHFKNSVAVNTVYALGDQTFETAWNLCKAYVQKLRDEEFEKAAP